MFNVEFLLFCLILHFLVHLWLVLGFGELVILDNSFGFLFILALLRFGRTGAKLLFSDIFDLLSSIEPLFKVFLPFDFKMLISVDLIIFFGAVSVEGVFLLDFRLFMVGYQLHGKDLIEVY